MGKIKMGIAASVLILIFAASTHDAHAADKATTKVSSSKDIRFEDSVIEGMNQNSKDSLETIGKKDAAERAHLYKKRQSYKDEIRTRSRELGQQP
jgi:basic membrane lipoprotein Med (substrate-binding protein (PBP1-ABC) superfamily)